MDTNLAEQLPAIAYAEHPADEPIPTFGEAYGAGFVGDIIPWAGGARAIVVVAAIDGDFDDTVWDEDYSAAPGATSMTDGLANSLSINDNQHPAAKLACNYRAGGHEDWHLPAHAIQLGLAARLGPNWTEVEGFKKGQSQAYQEAWYWTSSQSQFGPGLAWAQGFSLGSSDDLDKCYDCRVRPVRIVLIR